MMDALAPYLPYVAAAAAAALAGLALWYFVFRGDGTESLTKIERLEAASSKARKKQEEAQKVASEALLKLTETIASSRASVEAMLK